MISFLDPSRKLNNVINQSVLKLFKPKSVQNRLIVDLDFVSKVKVKKGFTVKAKLRSSVTAFNSAFRHAPGGSAETEIDFRRRRSRRHKQL